MSDAARRFAPATLRNRDALLDALRGVLPEAGMVLEVASGTGEHAVHVASALSGLIWQPSDPSEEARASIDAWAGDVPNIRPAMELNASAWPWPVTAADALVCVNLIHIAPWSACLGLLRGARSILAPGAALILYGPFLRAGVATARGNLEFNASLRESDLAWGIRALEDVVAAADGFTLDRVMEMPANNLTVVFRRVG